jgi:hypothetical protein
MNYKKIHIYLDGEYLATTLQCKNLKHAIKRFSELKTNGVLLVAGKGKVPIPINAKITATYKC